MVKKFIKKVEDFTCEHCSKEVKGSGFTNHCPFCLWSKHVDIHPGDRQSACAGMMKPVKIEGKTEEYFIVHECEKCHYRKNNRVEPNDSYEEVLAIVKRFADLTIKK